MKRIKLLLLAFFAICAQVGYAQSAWNARYQRYIDQYKDCAIEQMLKTDGPFILECAIMEEDNVLPMTPPGMDIDKMMLEI